MLINLIILCIEEGEIMRRRNISLFFLINLFLFSFYSCSSTKEGTTFIVASDTHYLTKEYMNDPLRNYDKDPIATDGKTVQYNRELFNELLNKVKKEKPTYFIVTVGFPLLSHTRIL